MFIILPSSSFSCDHISISSKGSSKYISCNSTSNIQSSSTHHQIITNLKVLTTNLIFGHWNLFGAWNLVIGVLHLLPGTLIVDLLCSIWNRPLWDKLDFASDLHDIPDGLLNLFF